MTPTRSDWRRQQGDKKSLSSSKKKKNERKQQQPLSAKCPSPIEQAWRIPFLEQQ
jgi:hypothetical protein